MLEYCEFVVVSFRKKCIAKRKVKSSHITFFIALLCYAIQSIRLVKTKDKFYAYTHSKDNYIVKDMDTMLVVISCLNV